MMWIHWTVLYTAVNWKMYPTQHTAHLHPCSPHEIEPQTSCYQSTSTPDPTKPFLRCVLSQALQHHLLHKFTKKLPGIMFPFNWWEACTLICEHGRMVGDVRPWRQIQPDNPLEVWKLDLKLHFTTGNKRMQTNTVNVISKVVSFDMIFLLLLRCRGSTIHPKSSIRICISTGGIRWVIRTSLSLMSTSCRTTSTDPSAVPSNGNNGVQMYQCCIHTIVQ